MTGLCKHLTGRVQVMMKCAIPYAVASLLLALPASAEQSPVGAEADARIKSYVYEEDNVYKLNLYLKSVTALQFEDGEQVNSILIGDSASWEVVKLSMGNVISIKPIIDDALTNMTVYTDRRVYTFELQSRGEIKAGVKNGSDQSFRTAFVYPKTKRKKAGLPVKKDQSHRRYMISGEASFRPRAVADTTTETIFQLPEGAPRPVIFKVGRDGEEKVVNSRTEGDRVIVTGTSDFWVMRIGDEYVCVATEAAVQRKQVGFGGLFNG